jgi:hypothetical protein
LGGGGQISQFSSLCCQQSLFSSPRHNRTPCTPFAASAFTDGAFPQYVRITGSIQYSLLKFILRTLNSHSWNFYYIEWHFILSFSQVTFVVTQPKRHALSFPYLRLQFHCILLALFVSLGNSGL